MKQSLIKLLVTVMLGLLVAGCSKLKSDINTPQDLSIHKDGILQPANPNFHGNLLKPENVGFEECQQCHGADFSGGITGTSCIKCHQAINVHTDSYISPSSPNFHGLYVANHGWDGCQMCHGSQFTGGESSPSCTQCHSTISVHATGIISPSSENFHGKFIRAHEWDLSSCQNCHGEEFKGGVASPTCLTCHTQDNGPLACNTCHGNFSDPTMIAPPRDIDNNTATTARGVGAHQAHLYENNLGSQVMCSYCHTVPNSVYEPGHLDSDLPAELNFSGLAVANNAGGATYNYDNTTCANTYCHGNFSFSKSDADAANQYAYAEDNIVGANNTVDWTKVDGSQAACGTCHGLPPEGHFGIGALDITSCSGCHGSVVDGAGNIIDQTKHMNGEKNLN